MPPKTDANKKTSQTEIESDFQSFFTECSGSNLNKFQLIQLLFPLKIRVWKEWGIKYGVFIFLTVIFIGLFVYVDFFTWNLAAVGRLTLAKICPIWNWENLYNAKCLIGKVDNDERSDDPVKKRRFLEYEDCVTCENIGTIHFYVNFNSYLPFKFLEKITNLSNISYQHLYDKHLLRGRPVIITDSHDSWTKTENFASHLLSLPDLMHSKPCELQTNLIFYKKSDLTTIFQIIEENIERENDEWFLHFRNCEFEAIKVSRAFIPKPYYYSSHLEPPYTSWILLSQNYNHHEYKHLSLLNMVIVQQLIGTLDITIEAKDACYDVCGSHHIQIFEGEALVLMSRLWNFKYLPSSKDLSVSVMTETYFL